jgi:Mg-chelatase subunit ChlD
MVKTGLVLTCLNSAYASHFNISSGGLPSYAKRADFLNVTCMKTNSSVKWRAVILAASALALASVLTSVSAAATNSRNIVLLVDSSGSMAELTGGSNQRRIDAAKDALIETINRLQPSDNVGMRVFGLGESCGDGGVSAVPVSTLNRDALRKATGDLSPSGNTPTPAAIQSAVADLGSSGNRQIVLISDGESSCGDPCETVRQAVYQGTNVTIHTVGFQVSQEAADQLACVAAATGGTYFPAPSGAALASAINGATSTSSRTAAGRGTGLIQLLVNSYAHEDWNLVRALNPARSSLSNSQLQDGWGGMEEAWVFGQRERNAGGSVVLVDSIYVTHERVVPALAKKRGLPVGAAITQSFCITWRVDVNRRTVQEKPPRWVDIQNGYVSPETATRKAC